MAEHAVFALRKVAEEHVGAARPTRCIDPNQDFAVRRRLVRVFSVCVSQRAADGLMFGLDDARFDVRFQAARSLTEILEKNPGVVDRRGADVRGRSSARPALAARCGKAAGCSTASSSTEALSPLDEFVRDRAGTSLAHVFTLLALVLPREPLQIAFRSLQTDDQQLQRHGARVSRRHPAAGHPRAPLAVPRSRAGPALDAAPRGSDGGAAALAPLDHR